MRDNTEKIKKRKRDTNGPSTPSKKAAIERPKEIVISHKVEGKWAPIIVSTPGLAISHSVAFNPYIKPRRNAPPKSQSDIVTKELLLHSSEHPKLDYTAREEEVGGKDALLKHYVGVYDPATGRMDVMEARRMVVRGSVRAHQATVEEAVSTNMRDRRNDLGQTFGTKKARKAIASVTENAISPDKASRRLPDGEKLKMDSTANAIMSNVKGAVDNIASLEDLRKTVDEAKPRPKANENATDIQDVYTVASLIGNDTFKLIAVLNWQSDIKAKKEIRVKSRYVANRIQNLSSNIEKLKILRYILLLIEFYNICTPRFNQRNLPAKNEVKAILHGGQPEALLESVKRKFSDQGKISKWQADNLISHLCALTCIVDNYDVDMWDLKEDLGLEVKTMAALFHEIGAKITAMSDTDRKRLGLEKAAASQRKIAKLRLPLNFPKQSFARGGRR